MNIREIHRRYIGPALFAIAITSVSGFAGADFFRVGLMSCQKSGTIDSMSACPSQKACDTLTVFASYTLDQELRVWSNSDNVNFYCDVPNTTDFPAPDIIDFEIDGYSKAGSASAAKGCVQFWDGTGESCGAYTPFPEGTFLYHLPIPSQWDQWDNQPFVTLRLKGDTTRITLLSAGI